MTQRANFGGADDSDLRLCLFLSLPQPYFVAAEIIIMPTVHLLDYVAGNIRSLVNAINQVGYEVEWVKTPEDVKNADVRKPGILYLKSRWFSADADLFPAYNRN